MRLQACPATVWRLMSPVQRCPAKGRLEERTTLTFDFLAVCTSMLALPDDRQNVGCALGVGAPSDAQQVKAGISRSLGRGQRRPPLMSCIADPSWLCTAMAGPQI